MTLGLHELQCPKCGHTGDFSARAKGRLQFDRNGVVLDFEAVWSDVGNITCGGCGLLRTREQFKSRTKAELRLAQAEVWDNVLLRGLPYSLLFWFVCDVAERSIAEVSKRHEVPPSVYACLEATRLWALGEIDGEALERKREKAHDWSLQIGAPLHGPQKLYNFSTSDGVFASEWISTNAAVLRRDVFGDNDGPAYTCERGWQLNHLKYLAKVWEACGARSNLLLFAGTCPIDKEVG